VKKILLIVAIIATLCTLGLYAAEGEGCPHAKAEGKAGCSKACTKGKDAGCAAMDTACKALQADLATMEKGVKPAEQDAFLKTHADNLKKVIDMQGKMAGEKKDGKSCCKDAEACTAAIKANQVDLDKMGKLANDTEKADFIKAHQANLKKFLDAKAACEKTCKAKAGDKKGCDHKTTEKTTDK
jgi:hypothetical protein